MPKQPEPRRRRGRQPMPALLLPLVAGATAALAGMVLMGQAARRAHARLAEANEALERRVAQRTRELAESEARLRRVQQVGRVGGFEIDLASGVNRRSAEYMAVQGLPPIGRTEAHADWVRRLHPEDRERAERCFLSAIADDSPDRAYEQEYRIVTPGGEVRWIAARAEIVRDARGRALRMVGAHLDITALKQMQAALQVQERRLRAALDGARLGVWERDLAARTARWDARTADIFGGLPSETFAAGLDPWLERLHPDDRAAREAAIEAAVAPSGADTYRTTFRFRRTDDSWAWVSVHGTVVERDPRSGRATRLAGVTQDLTDLYEAQAALRASEEQTRLAIEGGRLGTWAYCTVTRSCRWSGRVSEMLGEAPEPRAGVALPVLAARLHPEDLPSARAALEAALAPGASGAFSVQCRLRAADGSWRWVEAFGAVVIRDPATGAARRAAGVLQDVTDRKLAEERQLLLSREVDHRAKNALTVVQAAVRLTPKTDVASYARAIEGRVGALARTHSLLAESRWAGTDLRTLALNELTPFLAHGASVNPCQVALEGPPVALTPAAAQGLAMVLHELATNATKYGALSVEQGRVRVAWQLDPVEAALLLDWEERDGPPLPGPPARRGFGGRVVEGTVRHQLSGTVAYDWAPDGLRCRMVLPLPRSVLAEERGVAAE